VPLFESGYYPISWIDSYSMTGGKIIVAQIYMPLLDEGVPVWRPVEALQVRDDIYRVVSADSGFPSEQWQFSTGSLVRCKSHTFADGVIGLAAYEQI